MLSDSGAKSSMSAVKLSCSLLFWSMLSKLMNQILFLLIPFRLLLTEGLASLMKFILEMQYS